ncbi:MAG TPA: hypothetical protein VMF91_06520 [Bryobacteraceae bacterium]|nr:hypothetical protein [Bryobacteraceae bacterium]
MTPFEAMMEAGLWRVNRRFPPGMRYRPIDTMSSFALIALLRAVTGIYAVIS